MSQVKPKHLVVAVSGATGIIYAQRLLEVFQRLNVVSHLIVSPAAELTLKHESSLSLKEFKALADVVHRYDDIGDTLSSGSFKTDGMVVVPCSIKSMSAIANCYDADLITRAADVHLKERRKLVLCVRETPLHLGHLRLMTQCAEQGAIIMPPMAAFYHNPQTLDDLVNHFVARICDQFNLEYPEDLFTPWAGINQALQAKKS